jgi:hypothetical protein
MSRSVFSTTFVMQQIHRAAQAVGPAQDRGWFSPALMPNA